MFIGVSEFYSEVIAGADNPEATIVNLASRNDVTAQQIVAATNYYNCRAKVNGIIEGAVADIDNKVAASNAYIKKNTHPDTGYLIEASAEDGDYYITAGHFQLDADGRIMPTDNTGMVIMRNKQTGEISVMHPSRMTVTGIHDPKKLIDTNESMEGLRGQLMQEADKSIDINPEAPETPQEMGEAFTGADGKQYVVTETQNEDGTITWAKVEIDAEGNPIGEVMPLDLAEYRQAKSDMLDAASREQIVSALEQALSITPTAETPAAEQVNVAPESVPEEKKVEEAGGKASPQSEAGANEPPATTSRIPVDEQGHKLYEQAKPEDTLAELTAKHGEEKAQRMIKQIAEASEKQAEELRNQDTSAITDMEELDAHEEAVAAAEAKAQYWKGLISNNEQKPINNGQLPDGWSLSEKRAKNGEQFYQDANGNIDLVDIPQEVFDKIGYTKAPLRLTVSMIKHVLDHHGKELGISTSEEALTFVTDVMTNFDHVRLGDNGSLVFSVENGRNKTDKRAITILLNSDDGDFYGIKTSGYEAMRKLEKRPLLWERSVIEPSSTDAASATVTSLDDQLSGGQSGNASDQSKDLSGSKDREKNGTIQENSVKNASQEQNTPQQPTGITPKKAKIYIGSVENNTGRTFSYTDQQGKRTEITIKSTVLHDGQVSVMRQDYDANGQPIEEAREVKYPAVKIGEGIINGSWKKELTTEEKLREAMKKRIGADRVINVLTEKEIDDLWQAYDNADGEAFENMYNTYRQEHFEDLIHQMQDDRISDVEKILASGARTKKLKDLRKIYEGYATTIDVFSDESMQPQSLEEFVADYLGDVPKPGEGTLAYYTYGEGDSRVVGLQDETGFSNRSFGGDTKGFNPWLAPKGKGISIQRMAERIHEDLSESMKEQYSDQDVRNTLLEVLTSAQKLSDIANYILRNRAELAEQAARKEENDWIEAGASYQKVEESRRFSVRLQKAVNETNTEPSEAQKEAGNYKKGHLSFGGYHYTIENPAGSKRRGTDANGKAWESEMKHTYGYILGKKGKDGDHLDMFINDKADLDNWNGTVYVVDQIAPETGKFDEHKVMYGFGSEAEARDAYLANYEKGWKGLGKITGVDKETFDKWLDSSDRKVKEFADHSIVQHKVESQVKNFDGAIKALDEREISIDDSTLLEKYGLTHVTLSRTGDHVTLTDFIVDERGQGNGTRFMEDLTRLADEKGWTLTLTPDTSFGASSISRLKKIYKRFGLKDNKGRNTDFYTSESMVRRPKDWMPNSPEQQEQALRDHVVDYLKSKGIEVSDDWKEGQRILDRFNGEASLSKAQKRALETASLSLEKNQPTVVSSAENQNGDRGNSTITKDGRHTPLNISESDDAKIQKKLESYANKLEKDAKITNTMQFFKTSDGQAYGFTWNGKIYVDPRIATAETPVHEYGHLWIQAVRKNSPKEWEYIKGIALNDKLVQPIIDKVRAEYPELTTEGKEDDFMEEVITQFSGKRGAERLREIANEVAAENGGVFGKAEAVTAMQRLKNIINRFWEGVAHIMGWHYTNANQIADRIMADMLNGVDPQAKAKRDAKQMAPNMNPRDAVHRFQKVDNNTHSDNFKNFFGDWEKEPENASKVVDDKGQPLKVYRGGLAFNDATIDNASSNAMYGKAFYATPNYYAAEEYAIERTNNKNDVYPAYVNVRHPFVDGDVDGFNHPSPASDKEIETLVNALAKKGLKNPRHFLYQLNQGRINGSILGHLASEEYEGLERPVGTWWHAADLVQETLKELGYDGVIGTYSGNVFRFPQVAVFDMEQVAEADRDPALQKAHENNSGNSYKLGDNFVSLQSDADREAVDKQKATMPKTATWRDGMEDVVIHTTLSTIKKKYADLHAKAKAGSKEAADELVTAIVKPAKVKALVEKYPNAKVAFVHAEEATGHNQIPAIYACKFEDAGLQLSDIVQINKPAHTGSDRVGRFLRRARFDGNVEPGAEYIIVDDHVTMGGTLRDLKDYIESEGGKVVAVSTLTASAGGTKLKPTDEQIEQLNNKGVTNEQLRELGIADSLEGLTRSEAKEILVLADGRGNQGTSRGRSGNTGVVSEEAQESIDSASEAAVIPLSRSNEFGLNQNDPVGQRLSVIKTQGGNNTIGCYHDTTTDNFIFFGNDADEVAKITRMGSSSNQRGMESLEISSNDFDRIMPMLVRNGLRVGIIDKDSLAKAEVSIQPRHPKVRSAVQGELFPDMNQKEGTLNFLEDTQAAKVVTIKQKPVDLKTLSDDELLGGMETNTSRDKDFFIDEYDSRHREEYNKFVDSYTEMLEKENTSLEDAYGMYAEVSKKWNEGGYKSAERSRLMAQIDTLEDYVERLESEKIDEEMRNEDEQLEEDMQRSADYQQQKEDVRSHGYDLTKLKMRELSENESCLVERRYIENSSFSFTGDERIESAADVAYIFRELENSAVENAFMVLIKDGQPTVIHLGIGAYNGVAAPIEQTFVAVEKIKPDSVVFLHNHPSGSLKPSKQDIDLQEKIVEIFRDKARPAIIINTKSGKYAEFMSGGTQWESEEKKLTHAEIPVKVFNFSQQVFDKDWNPETAFKGATSNDIAAFVSSHRLGEHDKLSLIVTDTAGHITGNVFLPWTKIEDACKPENAQLIASYVNQMGGIRCVVYGSYGSEGRKTDEAINKLSRLLRIRNVNMIDAINIDRSAYFSGVFEPDNTYKSKSSSIQEKVTGHDEIEEIREKVLSDEINDVTLQQINKLSNDVTRETIYQRLPEGALREVHEGTRAGKVDALFSRICESSVGKNERTSPEGRFGT